MGHQSRNGPNRKYLRVCGEELPVCLSTPFTTEIPPLVRRRALLAPEVDEHFGNTSACAEKSDFVVDVEYHLVEIPPRVRRRAIS